MSTRAILRLSTVCVGLACCLWLYAREQHTTLGARADAERDLPARDSKMRGAALVDPSPDVTARTVISDATAVPTQSRLEPERAASLPIEVRVLRDQEPAPGITVACYRDAEEPTQFSYGGPTSPALERLETNRSGVARFMNLPIGRYGIEVGTEDTGACRFAVVLDERIAHEAFTVVLGTSGVEGRVFGLDGSPAGDTLVLVRQAVSGGQSNAWFCARTNERGDYRIGGLPGGEEHKISGMARDLPLGMTPWLTLTSGAWRRLDFGSPRGRAHWTGIVRLSSGEPLEGYQRLWFLTHDASIQHDGVFGPEGQFAVFLPGDTYEVRLASPDGIALGVVDVQGETTQDLLIPGATLHGRVTYVGTKHPSARGPEAEAVIVLERADGRPVPPSLVRGQASYTFCALAPGDYVLTARPWTLANTIDGRVPVHIDAARSEIVLDVSITDP